MQDSYSDDRVFSSGSWRLDLLWILVVASWMFALGPLYHYSTSILGRGYAEAPLPPLREARQVSNNMKRPNASSTNPQPRLMLIPKECCSYISLLVVAAPKMASIAPNKLNMRPMGSRRSKFISFCGSRLPKGEIQEKSGHQHNNTERHRLHVPRLVFGLLFGCKRINQAFQFFVGLFAFSCQGNDNCQEKTTRPRHDSHPKILAHLAMEDHMPSQPSSFDSRLRAFRNCQTVEDCGTCRASQQAEESAMPG